MKLVLGLADVTTEALKWKVDPSGSLCFYDQLGRTVCCKPFSRCRVGSVYMADMVSVVLIWFPYVLG